MTSVIEIEKGLNGSLSAYGIARSTVQGSPLTLDNLHKIDAYWRACNYLALGMIYLQDNPLLKTPLKPEHIKNRLLGHWGSSPGLAFIYVHLNRMIKKLDQNTISWPDRDMARRACSRPHTSRAATPRFIRTKAKTSAACTSFSSSSRSPAVSEAIAPGNAGLNARSR